LSAFIIRTIYPLVIVISQGGTLVRKAGSEALPGTVRLYLSKSRLEESVSQMSLLVGVYAKPDMLLRPLIRARLSTCCVTRSAGTGPHNSRVNRLKEPEPYVNYAKQSETLKHFANTSGSSLVVLKKDEEPYTLPHPIWSKEEAEGVEVTHRKPKGVTDHLAYLTVSTMRLAFDIFSGYKLQLKLGTLDERAVLIRCIFLETVAGVPGFAAGMIRHLSSLRRMERDHGWIHTLIEVIYIMYIVYCINIITKEAENERMHLMTFLQLRHPGPVFRAMVIATQLSFTAAFSLAYLLSPHFCHR